MWLLDGLFTAIFRRLFGEGKITGILGTVTRSTLSVNIWERTA